MAVIYVFFSRICLILRYILQHRSKEIIVISISSQVLILLQVQVDGIRSFYIYIKRKVYSPDICVSHNNLLGWFGKKGIDQAISLKKEILDRILVNIYGELKIIHTFKMEISISILDYHSPWTL